MKNIGMDTVLFYQLAIFLNLKELKNYFSKC